MIARKVRGALTRGSAVNAVFVLLLSSSASFAATPLKLSGALSGSVRDMAGVPQMGATVLLFNHYDKLIQTALTNAGGAFAFDSLASDTYSVRVTLASFVPALKHNIAVQPGMQSVLAINLASFLSSIELVGTRPHSSGALMSDDWKWTLRSSMATRPVLRLVPRIDISDPDDRPKPGSSAFSETRGVLKVSSGESSPFTELGNQPDLGTTFALATSLYGATQLHFSGNIGYAANSNLPASGFRTTFSRNDVSTPEIKLTMQQISLPSTGGLLGGQQQENLPAVRTMSLAAVDRIDITDNIDFDFGVSLDSVSFISRLHYVSPFGRLNYHLGRNGTASVGYSSGAPPVELLNRGEDRDETLQQDIAALGLFPRISVRNGREHVQRTENVEVGYKIDIGSRSYSVAVYREAVSNAALTMSAPEGFYDSGELLPELSSRSFIFNVGGYKRAGYTASVQQSVGDDFAVTLAYGSGSVLRTDGRELQTADPQELRRMIRPSRQRWAVGRISGIAPVTGTRFVTSYEWTDYRALTPGHVYLTQTVYPEAGLNLRLRQPLPAFAGLPGRLEATAEMRNMLAQGYLSIKTADRQNLLLSHSPRAVRGGVSFIF
ncbi:MAG TPA: TonB-dependent receptor [Bryobacteraceae bacterium]|nr:TonB-dependent receptor [Bryobacteraceae bacterium]